MKIYSCIGKFKFLWLWVILLLCFCVLFLFPKECKEGISKGIYICTNVLIPSLLPYIIIASFISQSGICEKLPNRINSISKKFFGMRSICLCPIILGALGGYPVGAKAVGALAEKGSISDKEAEKLSYICCFAGPGFLVSYVGVSLLLSKKAGVILLLAQTISIIILTFVGRIIKTDDADKTIKPLLKEENDIGYTIVSSVSNSLKSCANMCMYVLLFSMFCNVLTESLNIKGKAGGIITAAFEVTTGMEAICLKLPIPIIGFMAGFGGLCVHLQIFSELKNVKFSKCKFIIFRLLQAGICGISTYFLLKIFPVSSAVFSSVDAKPKLSTNNGYAGLILLLVFSAIFLFSLGKRKSLK